MKYRCKIVLAAEVLSASLQAKKKTHIMNHCNLNSKQLYSYLNMLIVSGLLSFDSVLDLYTITEKGRTFLRLYKNYREHLLVTEKKVRIVTDKKKQLQDMCSPLNGSNGVQVTVGSTCEDKTSNENLAV
jgi:predicted transcriptional regulator